MVNVFGAAALTTAGGLYWFDPAWNYVANAPKDSTVKLSDGRTLSYKEYGPANGKPVVYFHGVTSSRFEFGMFDQQRATASTLGVRVIAVDRPGYGLSDFDDSHTLMDYPRDIAQLVDQLKLKQFSVVGYDAGAWSALACAQLLPQSMPGRLVSAAIISPAVVAAPVYASVDRRALPFIERCGAAVQRAAIPFQSFFTTAFRVQLFVAPSQFVDHYLAQFEGSALELASRKYSGTAEWVDNFREALRPHRTYGWRNDMRSYWQLSAPLSTTYPTAPPPRPWAFMLSSGVVGVPVSVWHGRGDPIAPVAWAQALDALLTPQSTTTALQQTQSTATATATATATPITNAVATPHTATKSPPHNNNNTSYSNNNSNNNINSHSNTQTSMDPSSAPIAPTAPTTTTATIATTAPVQILTEHLCVPPIAVDLFARHVALRSGRTAIDHTESSRCHLLEGHGHYSTAYIYWPEVLLEVTATTPHHVDAK